VKIAGTKIKKGRYTMYAIPEADKWTMIINRDTDTWGTFKYDTKKDVLRTEIRTEIAQETAEFFSMAFENNNGSVSLVISWDNVLAKLPIVF